MFEYDDLSDWNDYFGGEEEENLDYYPDFFHEWNEALNKGLSPRFAGTDEICEILDIYLRRSKVTEFRKTIDRALKFHPDSNKLISGIMFLLNDFKRWNELFSLLEKYKDISNNVEKEGYRLTALLHLGMEEDAFSLFRQLKKKYRHDKENLFIIYRVMGEALNENDLFNASTKVIEEAMLIFKPSKQLYWILLYAYSSLGMKEKTEEIAELVERLSPLSKETWYEIGTHYIEIDDKERAIEAFEFSKSLGNVNPELFSDLIYAYKDNNNLLKAFETTKDYLLLRSDQHLVYIMAVDLASELQLWDESLDLLAKAIKIRPQMEALYLFKSDILIRLNEYKKAMLTIQEGIGNTKDEDGDLKRELKKLQDEHPDLLTNI
ncbi:MAG: tetratricopeptide repeat protein [Dysgonamonadaceae bacterium]|jgi:tetratricopeptide (TPR) repeat protein|nr:tetratricopeptide repeat protein [Dysgonamonadaceae bacterium]